MHISNLYKTSIPFEAYSILNARVLWCADKYKAEQASMLNRYAYSTAYLGNATGRESKTFYADSYGGGLAGNGGSARCGHDYNFQAKGIGTTPLLGRDADTSHSNGKISVTQAIYEISWAIALEALLPHGIIEHVCLIGTRDSMDDERFSIYDYQAILIRSIPLRLAHFERAFRFKPKTQPGYNIPRDAERVKENVVQLYRFLPRPSEVDECTWSNSPREFIVRAGLNELVRRYAEQLAFTRAHFLLIMTSGSNVEITGKLLDFTSCESILFRQGTDRVKFDRRYRELIGEFQSVINCLDNICYYLGKYADLADSAKLALELKRTYKSKYIKAYCDFVVFRLGFSECQIAKLNEAGPENIRNLALAFDMASRNTRSVIYASVGPMPALTHYFLTFSTDSKIYTSSNQANDERLLKELSKSLHCLGLGAPCQSSNHQLKTLGLNYYNAMFYSRDFTGEIMMAEIGGLVRALPKQPDDSVEKYANRKLQTASAAFASSRSPNPTVLIHDGVIVTVNYESSTYCILADGKEITVRRLPKILLKQSACLHSKTYNDWFMRC